MDEEIQSVAVMLKLVTALRHSRPHVYASSLLDGHRVAALITEVDIALIEADEVIHWSDRLEEALDEKPINLKTG